MMSETLRLLRKEHEDITRLLDVLERQIALSDAGDHPDYAIIEPLIEYFLSYPDLCHHPKEDLVFRKLLDRDADAAETVDDFLSDHDRLAALTRRFAVTAVQRIREHGDAPNHWFASIARNFLDSYRRHLANEETQFFPAAQEALLPEDWAEIDAHVFDRTDPLFGTKVEQRFAALRREILGDEDLTETP